LPHSVGKQELKILWMHVYHLRNPP
jgi:hypothetical protein